MLQSSLSWPYWLLLFLPCPFAIADETTTVVSVTSTKTVHVTATDYTGACENFVGACVVYGTYADAPYTTTVYVATPSTPPSPPAPPPPPTTVITSTTIIVATTTASDSGACSGYTGACVVYATNAGGSATPTSTMYPAGSNDPSQTGNSQGFIGQSPNDNSGFIGSGASLTAISLGTVVLGLLSGLLVVLNV